METFTGSIYDWPKYYEFIYGSDWRAETRFLEECFDAYVPGRVQRLFEPACGTGRLIFRLARAGYDVSGIDLNEHAVEYCNTRLKKYGYPESCQTGDIRDFRVQPPCDAAFNTINSFRHLASEADAIAHLQCMTAALRPGGIYVLGFHLTPTEAEPDEEESWTHRRGHLQVNARMWLVERNEEQRFETHAMVFDVYTPTRQFRIKDQFRFRTYTVSQVRQLLASVPEFQTVAIHDFAYDVERQVPLDGETQDAVFILQRR